MKKLGVDTAWSNSNFAAQLLAAEPLLDGDPMFAYTGVNAFQAGALLDGGGNQLCPGMPLVVFMVSMPNDATLTASDVVNDGWTQTNCIIAECVTGGIGTQETVLYRSCYHDPVTYSYTRKKGDANAVQPALNVAPIIFI